MWAPQKTSAKMILAICLASLLNACSMIGFAYRHIDWFIMQEIDDYLDLTAAQKQQLQQGLNAMLEEHRTKVLPRYAESLSKWATALQNGLSENEIRSDLEDFRTLYATTAQMMIQIVAPVLTQLSDKQIRHMDQHIEKTNHAQIKTYKLTRLRQEHYEKRIEIDTARIEYWIDYTTPKQRQLIHKQIMGFPDTYRLWYDYNIQKQQALLQLLRKKTDTNSITHFLTEWWINSDHKTIELEKQFILEKDAYTVLLQNIDSTLEPKQRQYAIKRLQKFSAEFKTLSAQQH